MVVSMGRWKDHRTCSMEGIFWRKIRSVKSGTFTVGWGRGQSVIDDYM